MRRSLQHFVRRVVRCRTVRAHAAVHKPKYANPVYQPPPPPLNVEIPNCRKSIKSTTMVQLITDAADLATKLTDAKEKLVIIDFFAKWCGPCKLMAPFIEELANEYPDVVMLKVDVDECEEAAIEYNIQSMPTFVFLKSKTEVVRFSGANKDKLKENLLKFK
ncbi:unnamed protein product [Aphis gossypii]|uniref:Thioredoxin domain-containing protein n=1 Tax=Aphis gossypii TaxID=80765 RepID=A0A9P0JGK3_APHGO|nr:unnamed protein product [Aphis gossypii]